MYIILLYFYTTGSTVGFFTSASLYAQSSVMDSTMAVTSLSNRKLALHYNLMGPLSSVWSVIDQNVIMWPITV